VRFFFLFCYSQVRDEDLITYCGMAEKEVAMFRSAVDAVNELAEGEGGGMVEGEEGDQGEYYAEEDGEAAGAYEEDGERYSATSHEEGVDGENGEDDGMGRVVGEPLYNNRSTPVDEDVFGYEDELEVAEDDASYDEDPDAGGN